MLLAIDSGNTDLVAGVYDGDEKRGKWRATTDPGRSADEYAVLFTQWLDQIDLSPADLTGAIIASVVPKTLGELRAACAATFGGVPLVVGEAGVTLGIEVLVDHPEEVGADRLVNAVAAYTRYGGPLIVLDFGTATTFDVIDDAGSYRGGVIAPGVGLSVEALHQAAAKLPRIEVAAPPSVIGTGTVGAMQSGIYWGYVSLIEGLIERITKELEGVTAPNPTVIATGGLASLFAGGTEAIGSVDPDLTLCGLVEVYRRSR